MVLFVCLCNVDYARIDFMMQFRLRGLEQDSHPFGVVSVISVSCRIESSNLIPLFELDL